MVELDEGDSELARWKHQVRLLERENRRLRAAIERHKAETWGRGAAHHEADRELYEALEAPRHS